MSGRLTRMGANTRFFIKQVLTETTPASSKENTLAPELTNILWPTSAENQMGSYPFSANMKLEDNKGITEQYPSTGSLFEGIENYRFASENSVSTYILDTNERLSASTEFELTSFWPTDVRLEPTIKVTNGSTTFDEGPNDEIVLGYYEMGQALYLMTSLEEDDKTMAVDASVVTTASSVALSLADHSIPAPKVFNHGSKSVVFNWTDENLNSLYLTITSETVSAFLSSSNRQKFRMEFSIVDFLNSDFGTKSLSSLQNQSTKIIVTKPATMTPNNF